jgi:DNA-binding response OmpR family regulator
MYPKEDKFLFPEMNSHRNSGPGQQQKRILIVDDDPDIAIILRMVLEDNGFKTDSYTDPELAYKNFRGEFYDLILLDIKMPEVDGFQLYQKVRKIDNSVKICFLTASEYYYEQFRKEQEFDALKQETFLRKPIATEDLVHEIKKLLQSK